MPVKRLNQQVNRNADRFPRDFIFRLSVTEYENLRLQFATSSFGHGGRRSLPYAFTEHGAIMAATILNSERAIQMSIFVVRAFVRMREALAANQQIVAKLSELEGRLEGHDAHPTTRRNHSRAHGSSPAERTRNWICRPIKFCPGPPQSYASVCMNSGPSDANSISQIAA